MIDELNSRHLVSHDDSFKTTSIADMIAPDESAFRNQYEGTSATISSEPVEPNC